MTASVDKSTYVGQYVSRIMRIKKMDSGNKLRLRTLHAQLGTLLVQRKALNSKVTTRHFELLREAVDDDADPYEIKSRLTRLEQSLKQEGLYKNVKADFVHLRKDILGLLQWTPADAAQYQQKNTLPGIHTVGPKDRTFYVATKGEDHAAASGATQTSKIGSSSSLSSDDLRILNSAIGKLYRHLQLAQKEQEMTSVEMTIKDATQQKENMNVLTLSHVQPDESFHDIVLKIRNFEKEFQRQKVQQLREFKRLQEEIKRLNKISVDLKKENERMKGVQPIMSIAKGKQVERLEERHRTEKKDMEEKIHELETGMRRGFAQLLHGKEEIRSQIRTDVDDLTTSINHLHHLVLGHKFDVTSVKSGADDDELLPTKELLNMLTSVAGGVQVLKMKATEQTKKVEDLMTWRRCLKEVDREITRFSRAYAADADEDTDVKDPTLINQETDPYIILASSKNKLQKTKENISIKLKMHSDTASLMKRKERDASKYRQSLEELQGEIIKLHEQVLAVQIQDISISKPEFERRAEAGDKSDRSDGSADELPEAERQEQMDLIDKLRQIGTMVNHFQQLIIDRTSVLNKMENDMLPLKIRVNRLHEEITKTMTSSDSPDPADDIMRTRRSFSPADASSSVISKEIANMLTKLSKMELSIRHLLDTYSANLDRVSV
ncbi:uveal autoantigen with coiled-coil domains and ankyrin repeats-like isoform X2 [Dreissena polymorpha]|uniref:uveal autoantigen with coiled-coil domains and ankyrin repeats-like isoform X2 n=1 Tax=Dreissena polymorpha TaxID=45954 RepID=UPI002264F9E0|nr:uveal autoantigen with coiled-coil domains and ankyrin repeats-like isoform X2 [Dreissena polymorpha]